MISFEKCRAFNRSSVWLDSEKEKRDTMCWRHQGPIVVNSLVSKPPLSCGNRRFFIAGRWRFRVMVYAIFFHLLSSQKMSQVLVDVIMASCTWFTSLCLRSTSDAPVHCWLSACFRVASEKIT